LIDRRISTIRVGFEGLQERNFAVSEVELLEQLEDADQEQVKRAGEVEEKTQTQVQRMHLQDVECS
jgi:hypothetical protein